MCTLLPFAVIRCIVLWWRNALFCLLHLWHFRAGYCPYQIDTVGRWSSRALDAESTLVRLSLRECLKGFSVGGFTGSPVRIRTGTYEYVHDKALAGRLEVIVCNLLNRLSGRFSLDVCTLSFVLIFVASRVPTFRLFHLYFSSGQISPFGIFCPNICIILSPWHCFLRFSPFFSPTLTFLTDFPRLSLDASHPHSFRLLQLSQPSRFHLLLPSACLLVSPLGSPLFSPGVCLLLVILLAA